MTWIASDRLFDGEYLRVGWALRLEGDRIVDLAPMDQSMDATHVRGLLTPGYVDLQVNGGGGVLLNAAPTVEGMEAIAAVHRRLGTVAILPTLITDRPEVMDRAVEAALAARGRTGVIGIHLEGPHISVARRGTHAARYVRPLDERTLAAIRRLREGDVCVLVTLAPEATSPGQIAELTRMGALVSLGHSDATAEQARAAVAEGAQTFTHLFNAMSPLTHRAPGLVGAALNSSLPVGLICDGIHVVDEVMALALRARPAQDLFYAVSDAMPTVGGPDHFRLYDMDLRVTNGRLVNPEGNLAGAHVTMAESVARLVAQVGLSPESALRMAVTTPSRFVRRPDLATVKGRTASDLLLLDEKFAVAGTLAERVDKVWPTLR